MIERIASWLWDVWYALCNSSQSSDVVHLHSVPNGQAGTIEVVDEGRHVFVQTDTTNTTEVTTMSKLSAYFAVIKHAADAVLTAEVSAPAGSTGADKLDIAKAALEAAYPELGIADVAFETVWPLVKPFIDALVAKFKSTPTAAAA